MKELEKVNGQQLIAIYKNFAIGLLVLMGSLFLSRLLPFYFSPIVGLISAAVLYTFVYNNKLSKQSSCVMVPYSLFFCMIFYSFISIILNVLNIWNLIKIPQELSFFADPYIPALLLDPICFVTLLIVYLRRSNLTICTDCKLTKGLAIERGKLGEILASESKYQLVNLIWLSGILSVLVWAYYIGVYANININSRDWYVFLWLNLIFCLLDLLYFASRYYNIYLELKENGEIITEEELSDMTSKTYLRFYIICGNKIFLNAQTADPSTPNNQITDTPFVTKRNVNGITTQEVRDIAMRMSGIRDGELRFLFGRRSQDMMKHRLLRYAYFVNPEDGVCPVMKLNGEWLDFDFVKTVYNECPTGLSKTLLSDITRITTIIITQKLFDERGYRKIKAKSYTPTYDLVDIRKNNYDFQDDKWIRISMFNSDTRGFHIRQWWHKRFGKKNNGEWESRQ